MKNHQRTFNSNRTTGESSQSLEGSSLRSRKSLRGGENRENLVSQRQFYAAFESYRGRSYEELLMSEAQNESLPIPKRISAKEQRAPFRLVKAIRYLSAGAAFMLVFTALIAMNPFRLTKAHLAPVKTETKQTAAKSEKKQAVLRLGGAKEVRLLDRSAGLPKIELKSEASESHSVATPVVTQVRPAVTEAVASVAPATSAPAVTEAETEAATAAPVPTIASAATTLAVPASEAAPEADFAPAAEPEAKPVVANPPATTVPAPAPAPAVTEPETEATTAAPAPTTTVETSAATEAPAPAPQPTATTKFVVNGDLIDMDAGTPAAASGVKKHSDKEMNMLYHLVAAEAAPNWDYNGQLRIARVVANRLNSGRYGDTLESVITYPGQFSPVGDGSYMNRQPSDLQIKAAQDAMNGAGSDIFDDNVIGFCTKECYNTNPYFRDTKELEVVEEYNGVVFFKFAGT